MLLHPRRLGRRRKDYKVRSNNPRKRPRGTTFERFSCYLRRTLKLPIASYATSKGVGFQDYQQFESLLTTEGVYLAFQLVPGHPVEHGMEAKTGPLSLYGMPMTLRPPNEIGQTDYERRYTEFDSLCDREKL